MTKKLKYLVIHCTATPEGREVTREDILHWHTSPKRKGGRGWKRPGYSDMIYLDGRLVNLLPFDQDHEVDPWEITNGVRGINGISRHVVYVGGVDAKSRSPKDTRTKAQKKVLEIYIKYMLLRHPNIHVLGHYEAPNANKACPSFDVPNWLQEIEIPRKNIFNQTLP